MPVAANAVAAGTTKGTSDGTMIIPICVGVASKFWREGLTNRPEPISQQEASVLPRRSHRQALKVPAAAQHIE